MGLSSVFLPRREPTAEEKAERKELWGHPLSSCADDVIIAEPGECILFLALFSYMTISESVFLNS